MLMERIHAGRIDAPRRVVLYGVHGVGKSSWASCAPAPIFLPTEEGLNDLDVAKFPLLTRYADVLQAIDELYQSAHDFKTLVIDSADWLERLIWDDVCRKEQVESIEEIGYAKGYTFALDRWREVLAGIDALRRERAMHAVLIAHSKIERFESPETESYDRYSPKLHKHAAALVQEWADEVLFACYRVMTRATDEGFGKERTRGLGTGERLLRTTERPAHLAKNRLDLPDELPLLWDAYASHFTPALAATT